MISEVATGTQAATIGVEHTLDTETTAKTYVIAIDLSNMVAGDTVELRSYNKVVAAGASIQSYVESRTGVQTDPAFYNIPIPTAHEVKFTLKQTLGTGVSFDWSVMSLD